MSADGLSDSPQALRLHAQLAAALGDGEAAWIVGGAVRDALLGRRDRELDLDLAVAGDAGAIARRLADAADGFRFRLSDAWGAWRVSARDHSWQVDLTPLTAATLEQDLARRDLTVNAIAQPVTADVELGVGELIDPFGGVRDLEGRRLRAVGERSFLSDPLRVMRLARLAAELGFAAEPATTSLARAAAPALVQVPAERTFAELRLIVCSSRAVSGIELLRELGASAAVLPELDALRGIEQSEFHHLDVYDHTLTTLQRAIDLVDDPEPVFGEHAGRLLQVLSEPLANQLTRGQALRFGALLHDIAKPATRAISAEGRVTFYEHDRQGARLTSEILSRLRCSDRLITHTAALARHHLRLGFLVHERPLSARAVYHYLATCEPVEVDVTALSVADRLATLGRNSDRAVALHLELARELMGRALDWHAHRPRPPIRGDRLAQALGITPGPELGLLLAELTEAGYAGEIEGEQQAVEHARDWLVNR